MVCNAQRSLSIASSLQTSTRFVMDTSIRRQVNPASFLGFWGVCAPLSLEEPGFVSTKPHLGITVSADVWWPGGAWENLSTPKRPLAFCRSELVCTMSVGTSIKARRKRSQRGASVHIATPPDNSSASVRDATAPHPPPPPAICQKQPKTCLT